MAGAGGTGVLPGCSDPGNNEPATLRVTHTGGELTLRVAFVTPQCQEEQLDWVAYLQSKTFEAEVYDVYRVRNDATNQLLREVRIVQPGTTTVSVP